MNIHEGITVISLGGSVIVPHTPDAQVLRNFITLIQARVALGERFIIVVGGGGIARMYQTALVDLHITDHGALDTVGVATTRLNAELVRIAFGDIAFPQVVSAVHSEHEWKEPVVVASGMHPGNSTDFCAVKHAVACGDARVINLSNTSQVYTRDPRIDKNATPFSRITWREYRKLIPQEWKPGLSSPFDPVASMLAEKEGITVYIMDGRDISNIKNFFEGSAYTGTVIVNE